MRRISIIIFSILGLVSLDFFSKQLMLDILQPADMEIWGEWIKLHLSYNSGIAFSLPITGIPLQIITIIMIAGLIGYYATIEYPKKATILDMSYILILAGAISHAYERIWIGHVTDFIAVKYFAILNFADIFISIGACLIFIAYYVRKR